MTWNPEVTTANQDVQIGAEATTALGTSVSAGKRVECFDWTMGIMADVNFITGTGRKYPSASEENTEWTEGTIGGNFDYNGCIYPLASVMGSVAAASHGASTTAKDWIFTPPLTGSVVPQTYTVEMGDSVRARKTTYVLFTEWGYKGTRKDFTNSGKWIAYPITDGITKTASPTVVTSSPIAGKHWNAYLDSTSGGLGGTQLLRLMSVEYLMTNVYGVVYPINRTNLGWTAHVDLVPKCTVKLKFEANAEGMAPLSYLQAGTTYYLRLNAQGPQIASDGPGAIYATFQHDMAIKFGKPSAFADDAGVFALEWECTVVEDSSWGTGKAQTITVTNLLTAL